MTKLAVSQRQLALLLAAFIVTPSVINLPQVLTRTAGMDSLFSLVFAAVYTLLWISVMAWFAKQYPGKNMFEVTRIVLGKWGGGLLNLLILVHFWFILTRDTRLINSMIKSILLERTPPEFILLLLFLVLIYYGKTSVEIAARVNEMMFPILFVMVLIFPLLLSNDLSLNVSDPFFVRPPAQIGVDSLLAMAWFGDVTVIGVFQDKVSSMKMFRAGARFGVALALVYLLVTLGTCLAVFGSDVTAREIFPVYALTSQIHLTDFMDRIDLPLFCIYFPVYAINTVVSFLALLIGIASFTGTRDYTPYARPFGYLLLLTSLIAFPGTIEVGLFSNYGMPVFVLIVQPLGFLAMILVQWIRKNRKRKRSAPEDRKASETPRPEEHGDRFPLEERSGTGTEERPEGGSFIRETAEATAEGPKARRRRSFFGKGRWSQRRWMTVTHLLLGVAVLSVAAGYLTGQDYQPVARIFAVVYGICAILAPFSVYMEGRRALKESKL